MKLKIVEVNGTKYAEIKDDKPIYIEDGDAEVAFDAPGTKATITRLNGEAKGHREGKEAAEQALKKFEGITDPAAAVKALELVKNLDDKKLIDAGQAETVKAALAKTYEDKIAAMQTAHATELQNTNGQLKGVTDEYHGAMIGGAFGNSKFITEKCIVPADMLRATFGTNFKVEDKKIVAYDNAGTKIFSRARPGELADFDEAINILVDGYPHRDHILKGKGGGSGAGNGNGGGGGGKSMTRAAFEALSPTDKAAKMKDGFTLTD